MSLSHITSFPELQQFSNFNKFYPQDEPPPPSPLRYNQLHAINQPFPPCAWILPLMIYIREVCKNKLNGVLGHLCENNRLSRARRTSWGWWDEWDDTALQRQDSKFKPWRSEAEYDTSRSRRLPTILNLGEWAGKKHFVFLKLKARVGF